MTAPPAGDAGRETVVSCRDVTREFAQGKSVVRALRGVTLDVSAGELTLLVGPSGCGKTTLLSVVAGTLDPSGGTVEVLGEDVGRMDAAEKTRFRGANLGFVFQQYNLLPSLTAAENVALPLVIGGAGWPAALRPARDLLAKVGLGDRADASPGEFSGGQQQRVAIARALVHDPRLVVCDEPTAALDADSGEQIMRLLKDAAVRPGRGVIVVTHDPRVFPFADRTAFMEDGVVTRVVARADGPAADASPPAGRSVPLPETAR